MENISSLLDSSRGWAVCAVASIARTHESTAARKKKQAPRIRRDGWEQSHHYDEMFARLSMAIVAAPTVMLTRPSPSITPPYQPSTNHLCRQRLFAAAHPQTP